MYVRRTNDYLRLESVRDTIEWRLDEELDVVGWDVAKFLRLLRGSNPTAVNGCQNVRLAASAPA